MFRRLEMLVLRWSIEARALYERPIEWQASRKISLFFQLLGAFSFMYFARHVPPPGWAIAVLGAMAAVMAFRADAKEFEKVCWLLVVFSLMAVEMIAIRRDHKHQEESSETILRNGVKTLQAISELKEVKPQAQQPVQTVQVPVVVDNSRGLVNIVPTQLGINGEPNDPNRGKLFVNVSCSNVGSELVTLKGCDAIFQIYEGKSSVFSSDRKSQEQYFQNFLDASLQHAKDEPRSLMPRDDEWFSPAGPPATPEIIQAINNDHKTIVVLGRATYQDHLKTRKTDLCTWVQPPINAVRPVWHPCLVHNGEKLGGG